MRFLRSASKLRLELHSVEETNKPRSGGKLFQNAAPKLWNSLPGELKLSKKYSVLQEGTKILFVFTKLNSCAILVSQASEHSSYLVYINFDFPIVFLVKNLSTLHAL